ncbi:RHS repeat domain-containing protein [Curtobacterium sp. UNCCL20]|uniref:RHS repeat domain-containing protein n=1 Tax=Curtobacterium sp. UNCCL20 TaxID=1502773 RepID=UPI001113F084|nr:RHS repeat-associated core domain-containing protein [Curtobacterium sp. UNCCL20]
MTTNARVFDGATGKGTYASVPIAGVKGLPSSGVGAVTMMVTVVNPQGQGQLFGRPSSADASTLMMVYNSGIPGNTSNSSLLAVGDDGSLQVMTETAQTRLIIDVTGYYTSTKNGVGAGGLVPMAPTRIVDTRSALGAPKAQLDGGDSITFQVTGRNGIPAGAAAIAANIIVINQEGLPGWVRPSPSGGTKSTGSLNYNSTKGWSTAMSAQVAVGSDGKVTIDTATGGGLIDVLVDVQGYFLPSNPGGGFTPQTGRLIDTRKTASIASGATFTVQVGGVLGAPSVESGLSAAALTFTAVNNSASDTYAQVYADGAAVPTGSAINSDATSIISNTIVTAVGANGKIRVRNNGPTAMDYVIDFQGTYNSLPAGPADTGRTGQRTSATTLPFPISDQTTASVDVGTGNVLVTTSALALPGVTGNATIGAAYNSRAANVANSNTMDANRWQYALAGAGDLTANAAGVVYTDAAGTAWQFKPTGTQGAFTTPAGLQQTLSRVNTSGTNYEYTLKGWTTNSVTHFNLAGQPTSIVDRNGNQTSFNTSDGYSLTTLVSTAGTSGAKTAKSAYSGGTQTFSQTSGSSSRSVSWVKNSNGDITTYTDATGKKTTFGYANGDLTSITAPTGGVTTFTYDSSDRATQVQQRNTTAGSPGTAVTRFSYANDTTTQVADPRSDQSATVAAAKHTTYTLDSNDLVTKAVDAAGRERSRTYNFANNGVASSTVGAGTTSSTSTNTYDGNNGQSLTQSQSASGSTGSATYGSSSPTAYLPASTTDSSKNKTSYGYDGPGNQSSTGTGSGPEASTAKLTYNSKDNGDKYAWGAVKTAVAPGNTSGTVYAYDANNQLGSITPPAGTSLGVQKYAYDDLGRVKSHTDGDGGVTSYTYDNDDRMLTTVFSDGTPTVTNTYDGNGNQLTEQSATGTVTNSYDQRNRLISTVNTAGGGTVSYSYDLAGNTVQVTDQHGTLTHAYDPANALQSTTYPTGNGDTAEQLYWTDDHGRRTDTWLKAVPNANPTESPTSWQAHQKITYGASNKVTRVQAWQASDQSKPVVDLSYCYITGITAGSDCTASTSPNDTDKIQWVKDNVTGQTTTYTYDSNSRLTKAAEASGETNVTWAYTYDAAGNRLTAIKTGDATSSQGLTYNAVGQITTTGYTYDGVGNLTASPSATFTYNGAQQLTSSTKDGVKTTYDYAGADMSNLLHQSTDGGAEYDYTYGTSLRTLEVANDGIASMISDPTTGQPLDLQTSDGTTSMWIVDGTGSPAAAIADTGKTAYTVSYDPYGGERISTDSTASREWQQNPFGFKSGLRSSDANGMTKFGYRWQTSGTGGWLERDTLDVPLSPTNANRYAYAADDPINASDPSGRDYLTAGVSGCAGFCFNFQISHEAGGQWGFTRGIGGGGDVGITGYLGAQTGHLTEGKTQDTTLGFAGGFGFQGTRSTDLEGGNPAAGAAATVGAGIGVSSVSDYTSTW